MFNGVLFIFFKLYRIFFHFIKKSFFFLFLSNSFHQFLLNLNWISYHHLEFTLLWFVLLLFLFPYCVNFFSSSYSSSPLDFFSSSSSRYQLIDCDEKIFFSSFFISSFFHLKRRGKKITLRWTLLRACLLTSKCSISQPTDWMLMNTTTAIE